MTKYHRTIVRCLNDLDISSDTLRQSSSSSASLQEEFKIIKKIYFVRILEQHPDKVNEEKMALVNTIFASRQQRHSWCMQWLLATQ